MRWRGREGKKSPFTAFDDFRGINATTMADLKLPMGGKISENLTMVASTS